MDNYDLEIKVNKLEKQVYKLLEVTETLTDMVRLLTKDKLSPESNETIVLKSEDKILEDNENDHENADLLRKMILNNVNKIYGD